MSGWKTALLIAGAAAASAALAVLAVRPAAPEPKPAPTPSDMPRPRAPARLDAAEIATGRIAVERLPAELTTALEQHSAEIVRTAEVLETKQARIHGTCAPGSAIRVIAADGSVSCQRLPRGVLSVSSLTGVPRISTTVTAAANVPGGVGRFQADGGEDDFLVVPVLLPDRAVVTSFSAVLYDASDRVDASAYLYRSDDEPLAAVQTAGASREARHLTTEEIDHARIEAGRFAYFVYFQVSGAAGRDVVPISASISYRLP